MRRRLPRSQLSLVPDLETIEGGRVAGRTALSPSCQIAAPGEQAPEVQRVLRRSTRQARVAPRRRHASPFGEQAIRWTYQPERSRAPPLLLVVVRRVKIELSKQLDHLSLSTALNVFAQRLVHRVLL